MVFFSLTYLKHPYLLKYFLYFLLFILIIFPLKISLSNQISGFQITIFESMMVEKWKIICIKLS